MTGLRLTNGNSDDLTQSPKVPVSPFYSSCRMPRLPDFVLIGAMKAGTTTLFNRLGQVPGFTLPNVKEPNFFSIEERWAQGVGWYESLFDECHGITGEASTSYSDAAVAQIVSERMATVMPGVRIVYALRHPVERMRSHYRHQVLRARESEPFEMATSEASSEYVTRSLYGETLKAYRRLFPAEQILVYRLEDLDSRGPAAWERILTHVGSQPAPMPGDRYNVSTQKRQFTRPLLWLWERNLVPSRRTPGAIRRVGKSLFTRRPDTKSGLLTSADAPVSDQIREILRSDQDVMHELVVDSSMIWYEL